MYGHFRHLMKKEEMWAQKDEKDFWIHWLENYREHKVLWDNDTKKNASRSHRQAAYQELADLAKVINPNADIDFVRGRINAFRTCYRREFKKMEAARQRGIDYKPQLFYFDTLKFVNPEEYTEESIFGNDSEDNVKKESNSKSSSDGDDPISLPRKTEETAKRLFMKKEAIKRSLYYKTSKDTPQKIYADTRKKQIIESTYDPDIDVEYDPVDVNFQTIHDESQPQATYKNHSCPCIDHKEESDEYAIFGKRVAAHFRNMQPNQRLIAEKIISDVCIYARMERLTLKSSVVVDAPTNRSYLETNERDDVDYDDPDTYIYTT